MRSLPLLLVAWAGAVAAGVTHPLPGEALYRQGLLPSGAVVQAERENSASITGAAAACINCHRRSGLGTTEGHLTVPPIAGPYLYRADAQRIDDRASPFVGEARISHRAYTDETLARAIREGVGADGRPLGYLMPRYRLDDNAMAALIAYLKNLAPRRVPGVTDSVLHFATIITPDADPIARQAMLDVLNQYFADKNAAARAIAPRLYTSRPQKFRVSRRWQLHVWSLSGPASTWDAQLQADLAREPVFAVISGLGGRDWAPVHHFCQAQSLPCLFPNVDVPVDDELDFYPVYFSRGVWLEAGLIAQEVKALHAEHPSARVLQFYEAGSVGERAAGMLHGILKAAGVDSRQMAVTAAADGKLPGLSLGAVRPGDALVLWLRPEALASLPPVPAGLSAAWISGLLGGLENAPLPVNWRAVTRMAYPFELPAIRQVRVDYALGWFAIRGIRVAAPQVQVDTYLACGLLSETLNGMVDSFQPDYLIERIEMGIDHRVLTGYYPRLTLSAGERFASKGGYVVRFPSSPGGALLAEGGWLVPE